MTATEVSATFAEIGDSPRSGRLPDGLFSSANVDPKIRFPSSLPGPRRSHQSGPPQSQGRKDIAIRMMVRRGELAVELTDFERPISTLRLRSPWSTSTSR